MFSRCEGVGESAADVTKFCALKEEEAGEQKQGSKTEEAYYFLIICEIYYYYYTVNIMNVVSCEISI